MFQNKYYNYYYLFFFFFLLEILSIWHSLNYYDGFHLGLLLNAADELSKGKLIYKDFFYPYGILNNYLNFIILKIFNNNIFYLFLVYIQFYILGIFILFKLFKKILNDFYPYILVLTLFLIHPFILKPWHNYLLFFLISYYLYLKSFFNLKKDLQSSFVLGIGFLFSETFFLASILIFIVDLKYYIKFFKYEKIVYKILLFLLPFFVFFSYLLAQNIYQFWINQSLTFPTLLEGFYQKGIIEFILQYIKTFIFSFEKIFSKSYIFLFFVVFLSNVYFLVYNYKKIFFSSNKKVNILSFISIINLILISQSLNNVAVFKLATLSSFGIVVLLYLISNQKDYFIKNTYIIILILFSSMTFFDNDTNSLHLKRNNEKNKIIKNDLSFIKYQKYEENIWNNLNSLNQILVKIKKDCNIKYFANFTNDAYYYFLSNRYFDNMQKLFWYQNIAGNWQNNYFNTLSTTFDNDLEEKIEKQIKKNNIFFITDLINQNEILLNGTIITFQNYKIYDLNFTNFHKKKIILVPNECNIE